MGILDLRNPGRRLTLRLELKLRHLLPPPAADHPAT